MISLAVLVVLVLVSVGIKAQPTIAAAGCPQCFGFERLEGTSIYVERTMPPAARSSFEQAASDASARVDSFYGTKVSMPMVLACWTAPCYDRLGRSGARGVAYGDFAIRLSPRGLDAVILAHELSHIEMKRQIGLRQAWFGDLPAWFSEGAAVVVSDDQRYLLPEGTSGSRCRVSPSGALPVTERSWTALAGRDDQLYARAACNVVTWMDANGGKLGLRSLLLRMRAGERFSDLYQPPDK